MADASLPSAQPPRMLAVALTSARVGVVLLLVVNAAMVAAVGASSCADVRHGVVLGNGANLRQSKEASIDACCTLCGVTSDCQSWTFHTAGSFAGTCLQHYSATPTRADPTAVSGASAFRAGYVGCFSDFVPAPGVPPVRALTHFNGTGGAANFSVLPCVATCNSLGYNLAGVTTSVLSRDGGGGGNSGCSRWSSSSSSANIDASSYWCYCDCTLNQAAPPVPKARCGNGTAFAPGSPGAMAV